MGLSTLVSIAAVAQRRTQVCRDPCVIRADSEPPGRRPPAPGSHIRRAYPSPGGTFANSGVVGLSSALADSRPIALVLAEIPSFDVSLDALPVVANAVASRRQAKVSLRPLSSYGEDRASRPPSAPAPGPHISDVGPAYAGSSSRRLMRIAPRPFRLRVRRILGKTRSSCFVGTSSFGLAAPEPRYEPLYAS